MRTELEALLQGAFDVGALTIDDAGQVRIGDGKTRPWRDSAGDRPGDAQLR